MRGDHVWRAKVRRAIRGPDPIGGVQRVYLNLLRGLDLIGEPYITNVPYNEIRDGDLVGVVGRGRHCLDGYDKSNPILAGVAVGDHPQEWPHLFDEYPVGRYLVHCDWVKSMYERYYPSRISNWAVGIDTQNWAPRATPKEFDVLVYDKIRWDADRVKRALLEPVLSEMRKRKLTCRVIRYGEYKPAEYQDMLAQARAMLFMCEHETQGLAYQEALSCDVPVIAWDPGAWLDAWRFRYGETHVPATSVPFFDERCGMTFTGAPDFPEALGRFWESVQQGRYRPREYVLEVLTLEKCARHYLQLLREYCGR